MIVVAPLCRWYHMIVRPAEVVIHNEHEGLVPLRARADGFVDVFQLALALANIIAGVIARLR